MTKNGNKKFIQRHAQINLLILYKDNNIKNRHKRDWAIALLLLIGLALLYLADGLFGLNIF